MISYNIDQNIIREILGLNNFFINELDFVFVVEPIDILIFYTHSTYRKQIRIKKEEYLKFIRIKTLKSILDDSE